MREEEGEGGGRGILKRPLVVLLISSGLEDCEPASHFSLAFGDFLFIKREKYGVLFKTSL